IDDEAFFIDLTTLQTESAAPIREWLEDEHVAKTMFDAHKAQLALAWQGIDLHGVQFDIHLAGYVLDPTQASQSLSDLTRRYGLPVVPEDEEVFGKGAKFHVPEIEQLSQHL